MSFNTLQGEQVDIFSFTDSAEEEALLALSVGDMVLEPLVDVDLGSVVGNLVPPQGDNAPTAAFNSRQSQLQAAFQSFVPQL